MARGFGSTWGTGLDVIETNVSAHTTARTLSIWLYSEGDTTGIDYAIHKGQDFAFGHSSGDSYFWQRGTWTSGNRSFNIPIGTINVWEHYLVVDPNTSPTQDPLVFRDGVQVTASQFDTPDAPYVNRTDSMFIGSDDDGDPNTETWFGALGPIAVWATAPSTAIAQDMARSLARGAPPNRVYPVDQLSIWIDNDTGAVKEPAKGGTLAATFNASARNAPLITGFAGGPPVRAYKPWSLGNFLAGAAIAQNLTVVAPTQGVDAGRRNHILNNTVAPWTPGFLTAVTAQSDVTAAPAPYNALSTADKIIAPASADQHFFAAVVSAAPSNAPFVFSAYLKNGGLPVVQMTIQDRAFNFPVGQFDLDAGTVSALSNGMTAGMQAVADGWYRCWIASTAGSGDGEVYPRVQLTQAGSAAAFTGNGAAGVYVWGGQFEIVSPNVTSPSPLVFTSAQVQYVPPALVLPSISLTPSRMQGEQSVTVPALTQTGAALTPVAASQGHTVAAPPLYEPIDSQAATQGHTVAAPALTVRINVSFGTHPEMIAQAGTVSLGGQLHTTSPANAETIPEVASYRIGDKPIGQWTVGTDYVAATASTTNYVALQQNILDFEVASPTQGHTVVAPTQNQTSQTLLQANATLGHTADPVDFTQDHILVTVSTDQGHTVAAPSIAQPTNVLGALSGSMGVEVFAPDITGAHLLGVANAELGTTVEVPSLFLIPAEPTPAERIYIPTSEDRTMPVRTESRVFAIAA
jgi:hypothetical protein